mgnify:CR=1 FL=1
MTDNNYSECVDHLVSTMNSQSSPTNAQQSFEDFKAQVDKQRAEYANLSITEQLYDLGYKVDTLFAKLINICDKILEEDSPPKS